MKLVGKLGKGAYGVVYKVEDLSKKKYALKRNFTDRSIDFSGNLRELDLLIRLQEGENIVKIEDIYSSPPFLFSPIREEGYREDYIYFLFQRASCDLHSLIYRRKSLPWIEKTKIISDLLVGLDYLHSQNILHRDIKPSNILWTGKKALYCDFGISKINTLQEPPTPRVSISWYRSPEMFALESYGSKADVWALGCVFAELFIGKPLFSGSEREVLQSIVELSPEKLKKLLNLPPLYEELIQKMLQKSPEERISAREALQLLQEEVEEFLPPAFPRLKHPSLRERKEAFQLALYLYKERENYYWFSPRILFQALSLFLRYLAYLEENFPQGFKEEGGYHSSQGVNLRFFSCLYISLKYFSSFSQVKRFFKLVPKKLYIFLQCYSKEETLAIVEEFEKFLVFTVSSGEIYSPTPYEAADEFSYKLEEGEISSLLHYYSDVYGEYSSLEIFSSWWKKKRCNNFFKP